MGVGCWVRNLKNPKPKTQNPKPNFIFFVGVSLNLSNLRIPFLKKGTQFYIKRSLFYGRSSVSYIPEKG
jgi:hypothetical protein